LVIGSEKLEGKADFSLASEFVPEDEFSYDVSNMPAFEMLEPDPDRVQSSMKRLSSLSFTGLIDGIEPEASLITLQELITDKVSSDRVFGTALSLVSW